MKENTHQDYKLCWLKEIYLKIVINLCNYSSKMAKQNQGGKSGHVEIQFAYIRDALPSTSQYDQGCSSFCISIRSVFQSVYTFANYKLLSQ